MLKQSNFFYSQPYTFTNEALAKFYLSMSFGLSFIISSVAPTRSTTSYAYLMTKIRNRNLKSVFCLTVDFKKVVSDLFDASSTLVESESIKRKKRLWE